MRQKAKLNNKPSRLSKEQVIWLNCLILALFVSKLGLGGYAFANEQLERFSIALWAFLIVFLAVVVSMGPKSIFRTITLILATPIAMLAALGGCVGAACFDEHPSTTALVGRADDVTFELVESYEVTYYEICKYWIELRMRRPVLNGILEQRETLISVQPAFGATAELIDHGKNIRFSSPALLGRKAIARIYSTDWEKARKNGLEQIPLTPAEQKATGI
ncbi:MAG: hypothetical protein C0508_06060 [Cyanobacteria bacterium PR.023]|nr:hypothetical protein [Cyanobacteria bacterium PR.023]